MTDLIVLPVGCLMCGLLAGSNVILRLAPFLRLPVELLARLRVPTGLTTALAGLVALIFPFHGPAILGSLVPALVGMAVGLCLSVDALVDTPVARRFRRPLQMAGSALLYIRVPLGLLAIVVAVLHFVAPATPFF